MYQIKGYSIFEYIGKKTTLFEYTGKKATLFEYARKRLHFLNTPGPCIMRIHLVRYSTSVRSQKSPKIYSSSAYYSLSVKIHTK